MRDNRTPHSHFTWLPHPASRRAKLPPDRKAPSRAGGTLPIYSFTGPAQSGCRPAKQLPNAMLNEVYNSRILELAGNIPRLGRLERRPMPRRPPIPSSAARP